MKKLLRAIGIAIPILLFFGGALLILFFFGSMGIFPLYVTRVIPVAVFHRLFFFFGASANTSLMSSSLLSLFRFSIGMLFFQTKPYLKCPLQKHMYMPFPVGTTSV